jgi:membrane protein YqaA with SNARE-associated domain
MNVEKKTKDFIVREERFVKYEWSHYNILLFILVLLLTIEAFLTGSLEKFLSSMGNYGYLGAVLAGFFYTYGATSPFSVATFFILAKTSNPWILAFLGALSSIISECIIYEIVRIETEKTVRSHKIKGLKIPKIKSKFLKKLSPLIAMFIIASPLPDELAAALLGAEKYEIKKFIILAFISNFIGILFIVGLGRIF